jgi:GNAT superfamily N-acetyltransferase
LRARRLGRLWGHSNDISQQTETEAAPRGGFFVAEFLEDQDMSFEKRRKGYVVSDDAARLDFDVIHGALSRSYWSPGVSREVCERAARNSIAVGLYAPDGRQIGYVRAITDRATFANMADVFVLEEFQGLGLARFMIGSLLKHPDLQGLRRITLASRDARGLYAKFGFVQLKEPALAEFMPRFMVKLSAEEKARVKADRRRHRGGEAWPEAART